MSLQTLSDWELLRLYIDREAQDAFAELVARHLDMVFSVAVNQLRDRDQAEDVTQLTFVLLARKCRQMNRHVVLPSWLFRAATLLARDVGRTRSRRKLHEERSAMEHREAIEPQQKEAFEELLPLLNDAMAKLNERDRSIVLLRFFEGRSVEQVAQASGISSAAAGKRLSRAVERLRRFFTARGITIGSGTFGTFLATQVHNAARPELIGGVLQAVAKNGQIGAAAAGLGKAAIIMAIQTKLKVALVAIAALAILVGGTAIIRKSGQRGGGATTSAAAAGAEPELHGGPGGTRALFLSVPAMSYDLAMGTEDGQRQVQDLFHNCWLCYKGFDFGGGVDSMTICMAKQPPRLVKSAAGQMVSAGSKAITIRLDAPTAPAVGKFAIDTGPGMTRSTPLAAVAGKHDVYLTFSDDIPVSLAWFKFTRSNRDASKPIAAASYDTAGGIWEDGESVLNLREGFWCQYRALDFGNGVRTCRFHIAPALTEPSFVEMRLDSMRGPVIGVLEVPPDGDEQLITRSALIQHTQVITGVHDLWLVFHARQPLGRIASFEFEPGVPTLMPIAPLTTRPTTMPATQPSMRPVAFPSTMPTTVPVSK